MQTQLYIQPYIVIISIRLVRVVTEWDEWKGITKLTTSNKTNGEKQWTKINLKLYVFNNNLCFVWKKCNVCFTH